MSRQTEEDTLTLKLAIVIFYSNSQLVVPSADSKKIQNVRKNRGSSQRRGLTTSWSWPT